MRAEFDASPAKFEGHQQAEIMHLWEDLDNNLKKINRLFHNMKYNIKPFIAPSGGHDHH